MLEASRDRPIVYLQVEFTTHPQLIPGLNVSAIPIRSSCLSREPDQDVYVKYPNLEFLKMLNTVLGEHCVSQTQHVCSQSVSNPSQLYITAGKDAVIHLFGGLELGRGAEKGLLPCLTRRMSGLGSKTLNSLIVFIQALPESSFSPEPHPHGCCQCQSMWDLGNLLCLGRTSNSRCG